MAVSGLRDKAEPVCLCGHEHADHHGPIGDCVGICRCEHCGPDNTFYECWCAGFKIPPPARPTVELQRQATDRFTAEAGERQVPGGTFKLILTPGPNPWPIVEPLSERDPELWVDLVHDYTHQEDN